MMEGVSPRVLLAGRNAKLNKLIALYDDKRICIEGGTDQVFLEDVPPLPATAGT
jgi:transketolase